MTVLTLCPLQDDAFVSPDGLFRYWLTRRLDGLLHAKRDPLFVCMLNPSTADARKNDQTVRKLFGFATRYGHPGIVVVNAYALRSRDPMALRQAPDPVGPLNDKALDLLAQMMLALVPDPQLVVAWGAHCAPSRARTVASIFADQGVRLASWGTNRDGSPPHPLLLPYATPLSAWHPPGE